MIKIRYADLPEGLHVDVRSEGKTTVIYLLPALSRSQRRAALTKARQAALVGRSPSLPLIPLAFAICADRSRTTLEAAAAAARVHPVGFAVPSAILITAVVLYTFVSSVTIHLPQPPQAAGPGGRPPVIAASQGAPRGPQPMPGATARRGAVGGAIGSPAGPSAGAQGQSGPSSPAEPTSPVTSPPGPGPAPAPPTKPAPSPSPTGGGGAGGGGTGGGGSGSGLCVTLLGVQVCADLH